jgi:hypothetical protein
MDTEWEDRVRARAYALWEREGQPEGGAGRHWTQAEEELRGEEQGRAGASIIKAAGIPTDAASTAGTETWTGPASSVGGEPQAGDQGEAQTPAAERVEVTGEGIAAEVQSR